MGLSDWHGGISAHRGRAINGQFGEPSARDGPAEAPGGNRAQARDALMS